MTEYKANVVENMIRNYFTLKETSLVEYADMKLDMEQGLRRLQEEDDSSYNTLMGVFALGNSIQAQAEKDKITKMQVHRRLNDGLTFITNIMNGVFK